MTLLHAPCASPLVTAQRIFARDGNLSQLYNGRENWLFPLPFFSYLSGNQLLKGGCEQGHSCTVSLPSLQSLWPQKSFLFLHLFLFPSIVNPAEHCFACSGLFFRSPRQSFLFCGQGVAPGSPRLKLIALSLQEWTRPSNAFRSTEPKQITDADLFCSLFAPPTANQPPISASITVRHAVQH